MKRKIFIIPLLFYAIQAQVSISDINQIGNQKLDDLKEELIFQQNALQESEKVNDVESTPVQIINESTEKIDDIYFGYNYFKSDVNFFDNIPTPADFKLGAGDEIILSLWGETNSREKYLLNKDGLIYFENVGFINLSNKTINDAEKLLVNELSKIYSTLNDAENPTQLMIELGKLKSLNIYSLIIL